MFLSLIGSVPTSWGGYMVWRLRPDERVILARIELSPVLEAMGVAPQVGMGAVRFSLGRRTTRDEIHTVVQHLADILVSCGVTNARRGTANRP